MDGSLWQPPVLPRYDRPHTGTLERVSNLTAVVRPF
jgi:hypothetical protein